jgi:hypothetical protein
VHAWGRDEGVGHSWILIRVPSLVFSLKIYWAIWVVRFIIKRREIAMVHYPPAAGLRDVGLLLRRGASSIVQCQQFKEKFILEHVGELRR